MQQKLTWALFKDSLMLHDITLTARYLQDALLAQIIANPLIDSLRRDDDIQ